LRGLCGGLEDGIHGPQAGGRRRGKGGRIPFEKNKIDIHLSDHQIKKRQKRGVKEKNCRNSCKKERIRIGKWPSLENCKKIRGGGAELFERGYRYLTNEQAENSDGQDFLEEWPETIDI